MENAERGGYRGKIAFVSWVLGKALIDSGVATHPSPKDAVNEIQQRLKNLKNGRPKILGGFVEEVKSDGSSVPATRTDVDRLGS